MKGPLSYVGGKGRFGSVILPLIPKHTTYVEPFAGGAQIFFQKTPSKVEVLNDLDGELINFYRVCQAHHDEMIRYMHFSLLSREWFDRLRQTPPESLTDIQRAARYFYLQKSAFGGGVARQNYAIHVIQRPNFSPARIREVIERTHRRLARTQIERLPYEDVLKKYDRPTTFCYVDPPYFGVNLYRHTMSESDFQLLRDRLQNLKGKFLLSLNDTPEVREIFSCFDMQPIQIAYSVQLHGNRKHPELLIKNY
jgi:DNA adenine methylase